MNQKQSWEEEFDKKLEILNTNGGFLYDVGEDYEAVDFDVEAIKDFIKQAISTREREISEEVGKKSSNGVVDSHAWIFVKEVLSIINNK